MQLITANQVEIQYGTANNTVDSLEVVINDEHHLKFAQNSKEIRLIQLYSKGEIAEYFNQGKYFFMGGELVDYRSSQYKGYVQSEENLSALSDIIGTTPQQQGVYTQGVKGLYQGSSRFNRTFALGGQWHSVGLDIPKLGLGGQLNNTLSFFWSPFSANIKTSFDVERLVCHNGMVATSPFAVYEAPMISDWKNNLNILSVQLTDKFNGIIGDRLSQMSESRASVYDVDKVHQIVTQKDMRRRLKNTVDSGQLGNIQNVTHVRQHLGQYYQPAVFADKRQMKRAGSHITQYDLFNIATEVASHMSCNADDVQQLNSMANHLTFDELGKGEQIDVNTSSILSSESDHRRAFFSSYH
ncbi:MAG: hypothetical protein HOM11_13335 [Methylococcales bacterium]|jgi:hypothetical protein|nr:hypothetical protein [Methylococcales bacterium]MBT7445553.1 hypothetical protein [Methylococcales bacterium]